MLRVAGLDVFYGDSKILHGIDLKVAEGARVALIGRNGVGKSTLLKSVMNAGPRVAGLVEWEGHPLLDMPAFRRVRMGLCLVPEDRRILTHITVLENLKMAARGVPRGRNARDPSEMLGSFEMLAKLGDRMAGRLSGGQQQMLAVARGLTARPRLMLLDEPTEGLAPVIVEQLARDVVSRCMDSGTALLLCEQNIWFARHCTEYVYVLETGRVVFAGTWAEFDGTPDIRKHLTV